MGRHRQASATGLVDGVCYPVTVEFLATLLGMPLIGNRIAMARRRAGYRSQHAFANALGVSRGLVGQWEIHVKQPGRDNLAKIAKLCGITMDYLQGSTDEMERVLLLTSEGDVQHMLRWHRLPLNAQKNIEDMITMILDAAGAERKKREIA